MRGCFLLIDIAAVGFLLVFFHMWSPDGRRSCQPIKYTNECILWNTDTLYLLNFLLLSNLHGKRPADYAVSPEMLNIFQEASEGIQRANSHMSSSPSASLSVVCLYKEMKRDFLYLFAFEKEKPRGLLLFLCTHLCSYVFLFKVSESAKGDQTVVLLASKLSQREQHQLARLEELLEGRMSDTFSASGWPVWLTHLLSGANFLQSYKPFWILSAHHCFSAKKGSQLCGVGN